MKEENVQSDCENACYRGGNTFVKEEEPVNRTVEILGKTSSRLSKSHGEVATYLFLNDGFILPSKIDICVERKKLLEIIRVVPEEFTVHHYDNQLYEKLRGSLPLSDVEHVKVFKNGTEIMTILVYDAVDDEWLFRLDHHIRLPRNNIYFHSLSWNVDYIEPEIVPMYDLMSEQKYHQLSNYKAVIDSLSYYQFYILESVVGEQRIKKTIVNSSTKKIS